MIPNWKMYTLGHPYFWPIYLHIYTLTYFLFVMYKLQGANKKYAHGIMAFASSPVKYCNQNITQILQFAARIVERSQPLQTCKQICSAGSLLEDSSCQSCLSLGILWRKKWHYSRGSCDETNMDVFLRFHVWTIVMIVSWWCCSRRADVAAYLMSTKCVPWFSQGSRKSEPHLTGCCWCRKVIVNYTQIMMSHIEVYSHNFALITLKCLWTTVR